MSKASYVADLQRRMAAAATNIARMERQVAVGSPLQKIEARGKLEACRNRYDELSAKLKTLEAKHSENWGALHTEFAKDLDAFTAGIGRFLLGDPSYE